MSLGEGTLLHCHLGKGTLHLDSMSLGERMLIHCHLGKGTLHWETGQVRTDAADGLHRIIGKGVQILKKFHMYPSRIFFFLQWKVIFLQNN